MMTTDIQTLRDNVASCLRRISEPTKAGAALDAEAAQHLTHGLEQVANFLAGLQVVDHEKDAASVTDHPALHHPYDHKDVVKGLQQAWNALPACNLMALIGGAMQDIQAMQQEMQALKETVKPCQSIPLGDLSLALSAEALAAFYQFCEAVSHVHGHGVPEAMMQRLTVIGLVRQVNDGAYEATEFGVAMNAARTAPPATQWSIAPDHPYRRLTELKTKSIIQQDDYEVTGYVLRNKKQDRVCISECSAVRWLDHKEMFNMMHNVPQPIEPTVERLLRIAPAIFKAALDMGMAQPNVGLSGDRSGSFDDLSAEDKRKYEQLAHAAIKALGGELDTTGGDGFSNDLTPFKKFVDRMYPQHAPTDAQLLLAFNGGETVLDGLHEVLNLFVGKARDASRAKEATLAVASKLAGQ